MRRPRRREASWSVRLHEFLKATTPVLTSPKLSLGVAILNKPSTKWVKLSGDINWTPRWSLVKHIYCSGAKYRICPTSCCHRCKRCRTSHFARRNQLPGRSLGEVRGKVSNWHQFFLLNPFHGLNTWKIPQLQAPNIFWIHTSMTEWVISP